MNKFKIKALVSVAIATTIITTNVNTIETFASVIDNTINSDNPTASYGIANLVYKDLLEKGWSEYSNNSLTINNNRFKFKNLNGVNGKDAVISIKSDDESKDYYIIELLELMIGIDSSLTHSELALIIANGSSTIKDGSRYINIHYDGNIDYTITVTFYNYGYTPSYFMPSLDNDEMVSVLENSINNGMLLLSELGQGSNTSPIEFKINSISDSEVDNLFYNLNSLTNSINAAKVSTEDDYSVLKLSFNKDTINNEVINTAFKIDNTDTHTVEYANKFVNYINNEDGEPIVPPVTDDEPVVPPVTDDEPVVPPVTDDEPVVPPVTDDEPVVPPVTDDEPVVPPVTDDEPVVPPVTDDEPVVPPVTDDEPVVPPVTDDEPVVPPVTDSEPVVPPVTDSEPVVPPVTDDENFVETVIPNIGPITNTINNALSDGTISINDEENKTDSSFINLNTNKVNQPVELPQTGAESSLPFLGGLALSIGSLLSFKKKK